MTLDRLAGRLLVATPGLTDPSFSRTVVLLLAHTDEGALGVILNRPGGLEVSEILPEWAHLAAGPAAVFIGGPVQPDTVLCLGRTADGWRTVDVSEDPSTTGVSSIRLFAAYAGWSAAQLEAEIDAGGWYVVDPLPDDPFSSTPDELWRRILRRQGGRMALAATSPDDPSLN